MARLRGLCASGGGRALAEALAPSDDVEEVRRRQRLTAEALALRSLKPRFTLGAIGDVEPLVESAARGAMLPAQDVRAVAGFLGRARWVRNQLTPMARELPGLAHMAGRIGQFGPVIDAIDQAIEPSGEIRDDASPALPRLRAATREAHERLQTRMEGILHRAIDQGIAQEAIITERSGRSVIPIKAESRSHMRGLVHDVSSSGATVFIEPLATVELGNASR